MKRTHWVLALAAGFLSLSSEHASAAGVEGPIKVSSNGRYFVDARGAPFFWLGDTAWPLLVQYPQEAAEEYLRNRAAKGFTVIQTVIAWSAGGTGSEVKSPNANIHGDKPWIEDDPARPNEAFFRQVDKLLAVASEQGLVLAMLPTWGYYVNDAKVITTENARTYGRWVAERYRDAGNVVWVNGGDRVATGFEDVWRELARGLREGDGGAHLITYHPCGWRSSSQYFHAEDWLDFNMIETWTEWAKVYPAIISDLIRVPVKPVVLGEGAYENGPEYPQGPITPWVVRRQAWWTVMAGGFHTYGQDQMWRMNLGWEKTFDTPGAAQVGKLKEIMTSLPWWELVPDQGIFDVGLSSGRSLNAGMRSVSGDRVVAYLASQCAVSIHLDKIASARAKATWIHTVTGERQSIGSYRTGNLNGRTFPDGQTEFFRVPGHWEDAVLLLEAE